MPSYGIFKTMNIQRDPALWVALGIPVLMIVLIAAGILLPRFFVKPPQYSFLYLVLDNKISYPTIAYDYAVNNDGKLERFSGDGPPGQSVRVVDAGTFYQYDINTHASKKISFEDAQKLKLDGSPVSADGYNVETGNSDGGFPFGGGNNADQYLVKGAYSERLNISPMFGNTYYNFSFLGWVIP